VKRLQWRNLSAWASVTECGSYSVCVATDGPVVVTVWDTKTKPAEGLRSGLLARWKAKSAEQAIWNAKQFCQDREDAKQGVR